MFRSKLFNRIHRINARLYSGGGGRKGRSNGTGRSNSHGSGSSSSGGKADKNESTVSQHLTKTLITYMVPITVYGAYSLYTTKAQKTDDMKENSFGSIIGRIIKGERVWEDLKPRQEFIRVTRLNDRFNNYNYCLEKQGGQGKPMAELHIKHSEAIAMLKKRVSMMNDTSVSYLLCVHVYDEL